jgi:hypothetical protein
MVKRTALNKLLDILSHFSPIILTLLIIILFIKHDRKTILYLSIILILSFLFEKYEKHHVIPVVAFYFFNTLQVWLDVILDFISNNIIYTSI